MDKYNDAQIASALLFSGVDPDTLSRTTESDGVVIAGLGEICIENGRVEEIVAYAYDHRDGNQVAKPSEVFRRARPVVANRIDPEIIKDAYAALVLGPTPLGESEEPGRQ